MTNRRERGEIRDPCAANFALTGEISGRQEYDLVSNCPSTNTSEKMTLRFDQAWNLVLMAIALLALATPARAESDSKTGPKMRVPQRR